MITVLSGRFLFFFEMLFNFLDLVLDSGLWWAHLRALNNKRAFGLSRYKVLNKVLSLIHLKKSIFYYYLLLRKN